MSKLIVEVLPDQDSAKLRAEYHQQRHHEIVEVAEYSDINWDNSINDKRDAAFGTATRGVWVVVAAKRSVA